MGGDHHVKIPKVPDPSIYKVEDYEVLVNLRKKLAEKNLKDPWIRNHAWRLEYKKRGKYPLLVFTYGWKLWVPLLAFTFAVEKYFGIDYKGHGHALEHNEHDEH